MYEHFHQIDFWRYDDKKTVDMYDKAQQFARFFPYIFDRLASVLTQLITLVAALVALIIVSPWLGLIFLAAVIPGLIIQLRLSRASKNHWKQNLDTRQSQSMIEWQILQPKFMAELRLYGIIRYLLDMRIALRDKDEKARIEFERKYVGKKIAADVLEAAAEVIALIWTALQVSAHIQSIGRFLYVQQTVSRALGSVNSFVNTISSIDEDIANSWRCRFRVQANSSLIMFQRWFLSSTSHFIIPIRRARCSMILISRLNKMGILPLSAKMALENPRSSESSRDSINQQRQGADRRRESG